MNLFSFFFWKKNTARKAVNRRRFPRKDTRNLVAIEMPDRKIFNLINISEGGIQFSCTGRPHREQLLPCTINLSEIGVQISVLGKVVWTEAMDSSKRRHRLFRVGVSFVGAGHEAIDFIRAFVGSSQRSALA